MIYRAATTDEIDGVWSVIEDGRASLAGIGIDQWQGSSPSRDMIEAEIAAGITRVAVSDEGRIVGTLAYVETGEPDYSNILEGAWTVPADNAPEGRADYATLHRFAVAADTKRMGVGGFMFASAVEEARAAGFASVRVDTHPGNKPMQGALLKAGFAPCCDIQLSDKREPTLLRLGFEQVLF